MQRLWHRLMCRLGRHDPRPARDPYRAMYFGADCAWCGQKLRLSGKGGRLRLVDDDWETP